MMLQYWRDISNCNYAVSSDGEIENVISKKSAKFLIKNGVYTVELRYKGKSRTRRVDEIVAENFIRLPKCDEIIEHIDGNLQNNKDSNLRWTKIEKYLETLYGAAWKKINDEQINGDYYVSSKGLIYSKSTEQLLTKRIHASYPSVSIGYPTVQFRHVHVLVAKAFVSNSNPKKYNIVNHIDEDITNSSSDNLEWCTSQYNAIYSLEKTGRTAPRKNSKVKADKGGVEFRKGYLIYKDGRIYSKKSGIYLLTQPNGSGYPRVELGGKKYLVHLLVAQTFLKPHPENGETYEIDHLNGCKTDNTVDNLEWVTKSEQMKRCVKMNSKSYLKNQKAVVQMTLDDEVINIFSGIKEASRQTNINSGSIVKACKGVRPSAGGFHWKYKLEISP